MERRAYHTRTNGKITPDERQRRNGLVNRLSPNECLIARDILYLEPAEIVRRRERSAIALAAVLPRCIRRGLLASEIPLPGGEDRAGRILGGNVVVIKIRIVPRQRDFGCVPRRDRKNVV